jgi:pimeloyl-ACP methyl ester carboxylesterase
MHDTAASLGPLRFVTTSTLEVAYHQLGPEDGPPALLLHGFPYSVTSYEQVAPALAAQGARVLVPHLRGHGPTRFVDPGIPRSGQQAALGADAIEFLDALGLDSAVMAGYDWGGRAACVAAALEPSRVAGLVSVNGYLIQDIAASAQPLPPALEAGFWYFFYFLTERGRAGLAADPRGIADVIWRRNSPEWAYSAAQLDAAAAAFANPDYVDVVIHSYRHRLGAAPGDPAYAHAEELLAGAPAITVPAITLDGMADGNFPATDGSHQAHLFTDRREHRRVPHAGHDLPQETPDAFVRAVADLLDRAS